MLCSEGLHEIASVSPQHNFTASSPFVLTQGGLCRAEPLAPVGVPGKVLNQGHLSDLARWPSDLGSRLHRSCLLQSTALLILLWTGGEWPESKFLRALGPAPNTKIKDKNHRNRLQDAFKWRILLSGRNLHCINVKSQVHKAACEGGQRGHFLQKNSLELCNLVHDLRSPTHHTPFQT